MKRRTSGNKKGGKNNYDNVMMITDSKRDTIMLPFISVKLVNRSIFARMFTSKILL